MKMQSILFGLLLLISLSGCSAVTAQVAPAVVTPLPSPDPDKAVVTGKMINQTDNKPMANYLVRLAKIYGEGSKSIYVFNDSADPGGFTQADGSFTITDVEPGSYVILIAMNNDVVISIQDNADKVKTVDAVAGKTADAGDIKVDLAAPNKK